MALSPTQTALCNSLGQKFDPLVRPAKDSKSGFKAQMRNFISELKKASYSNQNDINNKLSLLQTQVNGILPESSLTAMKDLKKFIDACNFLGTSNPASVLYGCTKGIFKKIDEFIGNIAPEQEFGLGALADLMNKLLSDKDKKVSNDLKRADQLLDCMTALCPGYDVTQKHATLTGLFSSYKLVTDPLNPKYGNIDYDVVYTSAGLTSSQKTGMNTAVGGITAIKLGAFDSVNNSVSQVKYLTKMGGFF